MKHYSKKRWFYIRHEGRRYKTRREMSPAWARRARRYAAARDIDVKGIFRRVDLSKTRLMALEVKPRSSPTPSRHEWSSRVPPRWRLRGAWVELTS
jgi:hypothetical protein